MATAGSTFMSGFPSNDCIKQRINSRFDQLLNGSDVYGYRPFVCCVCDELIFRKEDIRVVSIPKMEQAATLLSWKENVSTVRPEVEGSYRFPDDDNLSPFERTWLDTMALSPRGSMFKLHSNKPPGFVSCVNCKEHVEKNKMPLNAIANQNFVGCPPKELLDLNDTELSFLTPIAAYGYFFKYEGGSMKLMNGSMTFMRVEERKLAKTMATMDCMGLTKHVIVLLSGKMTLGQQKKAKKKSVVRTDKMIAAVKWLIGNNAKWKDIDFEDMKKQISETKPIIVDKSVTVESQNASVEEDIVFTCYYPDGATTPHSGGFDNADDFKQFVEEMKEKNFDVELKAELERNFVQCKDGDMLIGSSLLQFPYGICSMDDTRVKSNGELTSKSNLSEFLDHLSKKSDPLFQTSLFQLIIYSLKTKARLLKTSRLQLKNKVNAEALATGFQAKDLSKAAKGRREKTRRGSKISNQVLDAVDASARDLPHTDAAAKKARSSMESMLHHFGMGSVFFTVTFDDQNSFLMQILTGVQIDEGESIEDLTTAQLEERAKKREFLRYDFPGVAAVNFEMLLHILMEEVLCWDMENNEPLDGKCGLFGPLEAVSFAVEEQGRKTLHAHFILWVKGYQELQKQLFFGDWIQKQSAKVATQKYYDHLASTKLFPTDTNVIRRAFDHVCEVAKELRSCPDVITDQELRYLRHKKGYEASAGEFASCPHCDKSWTYEMFITDYMEQEEGIRDYVTVLPPVIDPEPVKPGTLPKARMHAMCVDYQRPNKRKHEEPTLCIDATYQSHVSCHHKNCFKCSKLRGNKKRKHKCGPKCECRYRLPDRSRVQTQIKTEHEGSPWFTWNGQKKTQPIVQFLPKRNRYDLFQNVGCPAVSQSKFTCNSNVAVITDGPIAMYSCKYTTKGNRADDTMEYAEVEATMKKMEGEGAKHQNARSEALRMICRAAFAHNRANVISSTMASYLTRHDSRFYFSEKFVYCPVRDVIRLHNRQDITGVLNVTPDGKCFFENQALHYLCRPVELESLSLKEFTERYEFGYTRTRKPKKNDDNPVMPFLPDTGHFKHPSAVTKGKGAKKQVMCKQGVRSRTEKVVLKIPQWAFPDSANFRQDILTCADTEVNRSMEVYAQLVLSLLLPHRTREELQSVQSDVYPHAFRLREVYEDDEHRKTNNEEPQIFTDSNLKFLQNVQNSAYNSLRYKNISDDLQSSTDPFQVEEEDLNPASDDEEEGEEEGMVYEYFLEQIEKEFSRPLHDQDERFLMSTLKHFSFKHVRNKGQNACGYRTDLEIPEQEPCADFIQTTANPRGNTANDTAKDDFPGEKKKYTVREINQVLMHRSTISPRTVWKGKKINVTDATGSIESIREWSKTGFGTDRKQQRAFEAIIAAFLLTFYDVNGDLTHDGNQNANDNTADARRHRRNMTALLKLKSSTTDKQLICLLHGPGGSGKSTVVNMVKAYARSFCDVLGHPFDRRTITVTAMSGVAATLLQGETTHSALGLNKKDIGADHKLEFADTRLVIIDEISFASRKDIENIQNCLKVLMGSSYKSYGGANVVFAGDYCQLDPVRSKENVCDSKDIPEFHHALNLFIELDGKHRFKDDPPWGDRLSRFRMGEPTPTDIRYINENASVETKNPPKKIQVATYFNKNRDAINSAIFEDYCEEHAPPDGSVLSTACVILMDQLQMTDSIRKYVPIDSSQVKRFFYENCGENDCKLAEGATGRVDPILKLYPNCPMMLTQNNDVPMGQANGSRLFLVGIKAVPGEEPHTMQLDCGTKVKAFSLLKCKNWY